jgi:hypothetical protein
VWRVRLYSLTFLGSSLGVWHVNVCRGSLRYGQPVLVCSVEEGSGQLGFVALGLVKAVVVCSVPLALVKLGFGSFSY